MNHATHSGPATTEQLQELLGVMLSQLVKQLRTTPTAALLSVARLLLADQGRLGIVITPKEHKVLERLYGLLVRRLLEALEGPDKPSAAVLSEVRQFLAAQGISKDLPGALDRAEALRAIDAARLPFKPIDTLQ
jgi:hypothetical protein